MVGQSEYIRVWWTSQLGLRKSEEECDMNEYELQTWGVGNLRKFE